MKIALIEDEQKEIEHLSQLLDEGFRNSGIKIDCLDYFKSGESFLGAWHAEMYDVIFLDMYMEEILGIDVARKIREADNDVKLIFCTTSNEFASESYSVNASYYLKKPIEQADIQSMIERINLSGFELARFVLLPDGQRLVLRNIIFAEYNNHIIFVHNKVGNDIQIRISLSDFEKLIAEHTFMVSCCKGVIVNLYEVAKRKDDVFMMSNGASVPISRRKSKEIENIYADFVFDIIREEMTI